MDTDGPLRRLAFARPGMRLISHREVVLPLFSLTLDVVIQEQKPLAPIEEFILRAIQAGIDSLDSIREFLGLERELVEAATYDLWQRDDVDLVAGRARLTGTGKAVLDDAVARAPVRREVTVEFDRMLFAVTGPVVSRRLKPFHVNQQGLDELPLPRGQRRRPRIEDLDIESVADAVKRSLKASGLTTEVLALRGVVRTDRIYEEALILIYESDDGVDMNVAVAVDGRLSQPHEEALGAAGGIERIGIDLAALRASRPELTELAPDELVAHVADDASVLELEREVDSLRRQGSPTGVNEESPQDDARQTDSALVEAQARLDAIPVRRLRMHDHAPLLRRAVSAAKMRLLIISPWISPAVVDDGFMSELRGTARRGVPIHIGYGIGGSVPQQRPRDPVAERRLRSLMNEYSNVILTELGDTHAKVLIFDDVYVSTSFNWLSFRGDPERTYRQEEGLLVRVPELVDYYYEDHRGRIEDPAGHASAPLPAISDTFFNRDWATPSLDPIRAEIDDAIASGESTLVEFKSTGMWDLETKQRSPQIEWAIVKTIAAFMNSAGGTLLVGINDEGEVVGIEQDFAFLRKRDTDGWGLWLNDIVGACLGRPELAGVDVRIAEIGGRAVARVKVAPWDRPVFATPRKGEKRPQFLVRLNNSTHELHGPDAYDYQQKRWGKRP